MSLSIFLNVNIAIEKNISPLRKKKKNQIKSLNNEEITFGKISALKAYTDTKSYKEENSFKIKKN